MILTERYDFVECRVIKLDLSEVNEQKYLYFTHAKTPHLLFCPKIEKQIPICQFCQFFIVSSKLLIFKKSDSQNPRKWLSCVIKLKILDFQAQTNRKKGFANNS